MEVWHETALVGRARDRRKVAESTITFGGVSSFPSGICEVE